MIVDVHPSTDPPHQNLSDHKYYRRAGTEAKPMEHDLVALHFGRRLGPLLSLRIESLLQANGADGDFTYEGRLRFLVENTGRRVARFTTLVLKFPQAPIAHIGTHANTVRNIDDLHPQFQARQVEHNNGVIHSKTSMNVLDLGVAVNRAFIQQHPTDRFILWNLYPDEMNPTEGEVSLRDIGWA